MARHQQNPRCILTEYNMEFSHFSEKFADSVVLLSKHMAGGIVVFLISELQTDCVDISIEPTDAKLIGQS